MTSCCNAGAELGRKAGGEGYGPHLATSSQQSLRGGGAGSEAEASTCFMSQGCNGGSPIEAYHYLSSQGAVTGAGYGHVGKGDGCYPYQLPACDHHTEGRRPPCGSELSPTPTCPSFGWGAAAAASASSRPPEASKHSKHNQHRGPKHVVAHDKQDASDSAKDTACPEEGYGAGWEDDKVMGKGG